MPDSTQSGDVTPKELVEQVRALGATKEQRDAATRGLHRAAAVCWIIEQIRQAPDHLEGDELKEYIKEKAEEADV